MVVGGGVSGIHATLDLATAGFKVFLTQHPRYIREDKCTGCGICVKYCPVEYPDPFNQAISKNKAVHVYFSQAVPLVAYIDQICLYLKEKKCLIFIRHSSWRFFSVFFVWGDVAGLEGCFLFPCESATYAPPMNAVLAWTFPFPSTVQQHFFPLVSSWQNFMRLLNIFV